MAKFVDSKKIMLAIQDLRRTLGLTQAELAGRIGKSIPTIQRYEGTKPPLGAELVPFSQMARAAGRLDLAEDFETAAVMSVGPELAILISRILDPNSGQRASEELFGTTMEPQTPEEGHYCRLTLAAIRYGKGQKVQLMKLAIQEAGEEHRPKLMESVLGWGTSTSTSPVPKSKREEKEKINGILASTGDLSRSADHTVEVEQLLRILNSDNTRAKAAILSNLDAFDRLVELEPGENASGEADRDASEEADVSPERTPTAADQNTDEVDPNADQSEEEDWRELGAVDSDIEEVRQSQLPNRGGKRKGRKQ